MSKHVHVIVIVLDYKSGALYLKGHCIEDFVSLIVSMNDMTKIKYYPNDVSINSINEDTKNTFAHHHSHQLQLIKIYRLIAYFYNKCMLNGFPLKILMNKGNIVVVYLDLQRHWVQSTIIHMI